MAGECGFVRCCRVATVVWRGDLKTRTGSEIIAAQDRHFGPSVQNKIQT